MIPAEIGKRVIIVGPHPKGKGGIASVVAFHLSKIENYNFIPVSGPGLSKLYLPILALFKSLKYLFGTTKLVHLHSASYKDFYRNALFVAWFKILGKKVYIHQHGGFFDDFYKEHPKFVKRVCRWADGMIGVSTYFTNFFKEKELTKDVRLLPNGIEPSEYKGKVPVERKPLVISYFGSITEGKGIFDVVEAIGKNRQKFVNKIELHIGGLGKTQELESLIKKYSLEQSVRMLGWLDREAKKRLLEISDMFIHPSYKESFGLAILEAMDYGLPIITTNVGGIPDLVTDDVNGLIVASGDVDAIAEAISKLIENPELRYELGRNSKDHAANFYSEKIEKRLLDMYSSILAAK